jgi:hypothetical protein
MSHTTLSAVAALRALLLQLRTEPDEEFTANAEDCWCPESRRLNQGHSEACKAIRRTLAETENPVDARR